MSLFSNLQKRGFVKQITEPENLAKILDQGHITAYCGVDPTGSSLHVGHLVPYLLLRRLQQHGHKVIVIVGGGTARIGDPSGKTETRKMLSIDEIDANAERLSQQLKRFLILDGKSGFLVNNTEWLAPLKYLDFLRDIGSHFSVNRMLSFETYKKRLETGLTFLEFNYQLLQSYDYLQLFDRYQCRLQVGGDDQWGNIVAGIDLIRRLRQEETYGLTVPLITRSDGKKMGKTEKGSLFLDANLTPPYEFYQYWRNVPDQDVEQFLKIFTELSLDEIHDLTRYQDERINHAKERLAWEITQMVHGEDEANACQRAARAAFGGEGDLAGMPTLTISQQEWDQGILIPDLLVRAGLSPSKTESRRLIQQGGISINQLKIDNPEFLVNSKLDLAVPILLKAGKKRRVHLMIESS